VLIDCFVSNCAIGAFCLVDTFCTWWYNYLIKIKENNYASRKNRSYQLFI
jgi:hypothetical protein